MFALLFNSVTPATGSAHLVEFPDVLQGVNVQIEPSTNTAWEVEIHARLDDTLSWVTLATIAHDDDPLELLQELPSYPQYRAKLNSVTGSPAVAVKVGLQYAPAATAVLATSAPTPEIDHLT
jgi:hypothetical protein